jgi:hypothetical protein
MIFGVSLGAAHGGSPIRTVQALLQRMGLPVKPSGVLDQATVDAINGVLGDWSDAPPQLRTGRLTAHDVARQLGAVSKYLKLAAGGAMRVDAEHY